MIDGLDLQVKGCKIGENPVGYFCQPLYDRGYAHSPGTALHIESYRLCAERSKVDTYTKGQGQEAGGGKDAKQYGNSTRDQQNPVLKPKGQNKITQGKRGSGWIVDCQKVKGTTSEQPQDGDGQKKQNSES